MNQPELGKKISELRKAKGLTQEELVEMCKLSVRTLIRIESGEVMPRSYTIKTIFAALDYDFYNSNQKSSDRMAKLKLKVSGLSRKTYNYLADLFNLKTNTMKKISILSVPFLIICVVLSFSFYSNLKAQDRKIIREKYEKATSNEDYARLFNSGQIELLVNTYYIEKACMMPDNCETLNSRKAIIDHYTELYNKGLRFLNLKDVSNVYSDSIAVERGIWSMSIYDFGVEVASGTFLTQWHYINGNWQIENEMSKSDKTVVE